MGVIIMGFWTGLFALNAGSAAQNAANQAKRTNKLLEEQNRLLREANMTPEEKAERQAKKERSSALAWILFLIILVIAFPWLLLLAIPVLGWYFYKGYRGRKEDRRISTEIEAEKRTQGEKSYNHKESSASSNNKSSKENTAKPKAK